MEFEAIVPSIKKYFFHRLVVDFVNKIEFSNLKYQTNGNLGDGNHKVTFLSPMNYSV